MCRLAAYIGPELPLEQFLLSPQHSLYRQSWQPREMREAVLCADGFGIGWHGGRGPALYLNDRPIWHDVNLPTLAGILRSGSWAANVRSATPGQVVHAGNCQPFLAGDWLFLHNGFIEGFHPDGREIMLRLLPSSKVASLRGSNDSSFICALLEQELDALADPAAALGAVAGKLAEHYEGRKIMLNLLISRPGQLYALRHSALEHCASLYNCHDSEAFPKSHLCASEAFDDGGDWRQVPEHSLLKCEGQERPEIVALAQV